MNFNQVMIAVTKQPYPYPYNGAEGCIYWKWISKTSSGSNPIKMSQNRGITLKPLPLEQPVDEQLKNSQKMIEHVYLCICRTITNFLQIYLVPYQVCVKVKHFRMIRGTVKLTYIHIN